MGSPSLVRSPLFAAQRQPPGQDRIEQSGHNWDLKGSCGNAQVFVLFCHFCPNPSYIYNVYIYISSYLQHNMYIMYIYIHHVLYICVYIYTIYAHTICIYVYAYMHISIYIYVKWQHDLPDVLCMPSGWPQKKWFFRMPIWRAKGERFGRRGGNVVKTYSGHPAINDIEYGIIHDYHGIKRSFTMIEPQKYGVTLW